MAARKRPPRHQPARTPEPPVPSDATLTQALLGGDQAALRGLIARYDRLVRYLIFRHTRNQCRTDPQLLDSLASETWSGFVHALRRDGSAPDSVQAYLMRIARNKCISALRRATRRTPQTPAADYVESAQVSVEIDFPALLSQLEELEALRLCVGELDDADQVVFSQLSAITERRWRDAAGGLGISESTLRSRWQRILQRLEHCLARRAVLNLAPKAPRSD